MISEMTNIEAVARLRAMDRGRKNANLYDFLRWKYRDEPIFERGGMRFPVAAYRAAPEQERDPESALLRPLNRTVRHGDLIGARTMRELIARAGRPAMNLPTFAMGEIISGERVAMGSELGTYFDMIDTCDALELEILEASHSLRTTSERAFKLFDSRLPLRVRLHEHVSNPVRSGAFRSVAISLNALIAFYQDDGVYLMLRKRSEQVAVHAGLLHVIPSFMFQPASADAEREYSLLHNIEREYLEELFDAPDPVAGEMNPEYFYGDPRLSELRELLATGKAAWFLTGIGVNLLNLRPDICTVLLIKDEEWYRRHTSGAQHDAERFRLNVEYAAALQETKSTSAVVGNIPLRATDEAMSESITVTPWNIAPCGAFAFWAGVDLLRSLPEVRERIG